MRSSKVKIKKQETRLQARIAEWDKIPASEKTGKSGRLSFSKPGSMKK